MAQMISVISSNVAAIGYDQPSASLYVRFRSGRRLYVYREVPPEVWEAFLAAPSKGRFLTGSIKGRYPYALVA